ncbi:MAG: purine-nucleoside phosphorylase, partial [Hymenobacteraceae bacterium]|nr:purine-nucleoside phosphorylase [Hymenobacteraceae bacterium]MDX5395381.1 purine-nucleoside phosphorylase [Hymenobacteraceae bacterium]MDX5511430.1 purine-nucleoside phosphorylase [Hymenobacteraceae bacterium]
EVNRWEKWISKGVLAVEMETSIIYTMAAKYNVEALSILSVSDNVITQKQTTAAEREAASLDIMKLALEIA